MHVVLVLSVLLVIVSGSQALREDFDSHPCVRECVGTSPMTCYYEMHVETYATLSKACYRCPFNITDCEREDCIASDGFRRMIYAINRQLPSPQIRVCENDRVRVKVMNHMSNGEVVSIHWHGIHQQNTNYMDGVSMLTQCPILPLTEYEYSFVASPHGTHYYHSHVGTQRGDGLAGALIVKPSTDIHLQLYQHDLMEHTLLIQDWFHVLGGGKAALHLHARDNNRPDTLLINGVAPGDVTSDDGLNVTQIPYKFLTVEKGNSYRFRVISNALMNCPIEMYIESHSLLVIASDGADIAPVITDVLVISGGERYDFVLLANQTAANYWVYLRGLTDCSQRKTQTLAILHYEGAPLAHPLSTPNSYDQRPTDVLTLNPFNMGLVNDDPTDMHLTLNKLESAETNPRWISQEPTTKVYLQLGLHRTSSPLFNVAGLYGWMDDIIDIPGGGTVLAQINSVNSILPPWPYLSQYDDIPESTFCDVGSASVNETYCQDNFCQCTHRLRVGLGEVVELVMFDRGKYWNISNHPMHIHGQFVHVMAMGQMPDLYMTREDLLKLDSAGEIKRNFDKPIKKDTIMMPNGGYVVTRFKAENPGVWFLHCHNEVHVEQGMSMVIEVGDSKQWPQTPSPAYKCGSVVKPATQSQTVSNTASTGSCLLMGLRICLLLHVLRLSQ